MTDVKTLFYQGKSDPEIATALGIKPRRVRTIRDRLGLKRKKMTPKKQDWKKLPSINLPDEEISQFYNGKRYA